ncbi:MAG: 4Fe-4S binding protein [Chloroflexi bacterium]|nr:4Fe-4S binding protein [Chloroflexota bacterium]
MGEWALPEINLEKCNRCGACIEVCPTSAVEMGPRGPFFVRPRVCTFCTECEPVCLQGAITCAFGVVWEEESERGT